MTTFIDFVSELIYGSTLSTNHRNFVIANNMATGGDPSGTDWLDHSLDNMLAEFEGWLSREALPPLIPWDGSVVTAWGGGAIEVPVPAALQGTFPGVTSLADLGTEFWEHYKDVADATVEGNLTELRGRSGLEKVPFSWRFWSFLRWTKERRERYLGGIPFPPATVYDYDGTILSGKPFLDAFNEGHWNWHLGPAPTSITPGFRSPVGQRAGFSNAVSGLTLGEEFIIFHREHLELFRRWLERRGEEPVPGYNMLDGRPQASEAGSPPNSWTEVTRDPWINDPSTYSDTNLGSLVDLNQLGNFNEFDPITFDAVHGEGHGDNTDFAPIYVNNYSRRFFMWHGWIDNQWWFREPRFGRWNPSTHLKERTFQPVLATGGSAGSSWPGMSALTIVRDPLGAGDEVFPVDAVSSLDLNTGAGTLSIQLVANDPKDRQLALDLTAEVFADATDPTTPVETVVESRVIGPTGDFPLDTDFEVNLSFASAFASDDPTAASDAVGFVNSRIKITGDLRVQDAGDPDSTNFVHSDFIEIALVQEKDPPEIEIYLNLSSFGQSQVQAVMDGGTEARFSDAIVVVVEDRGGRPYTPTWPTEVLDEVKGLILGRTPIAGLFDDPAHAPLALIWQPTGTDSEFTGLTVELGSGPSLEDASLATNLPQRFTYHYDVVFQSGNDAFDALSVGSSRLGRLRVEGYDRAGNQTLATADIKLFNEANPYMIDGDTSWLSTDTRVFRIFEGESMFGATMSAADGPNTFIQNVVQNLNDGTATDTFEDLPEGQSASALEYVTEILNPSTGVSTGIYNFTLAKVRLQSLDEALRIRAFFRLFTYAASHLIFDGDAGYRTYSDPTPDGDGEFRRIPLLGFESESNGSPVISIPFFAEAREALGTSMEDQTDATNVHDFPATASSDERVVYFGAWLDINADSAQLPAEYIGAHPDGGFSAPEVQPIGDLMKDAHQCMVVEVLYDGDPTDAGLSPSTSDNLAQRNLAILETDNPGGPMTRVVQHSFLVDTRVRAGNERPAADPKEIMGLVNRIDLSREQLNKRVPLNGQKISSLPLPDSVPNREHLRHQSPRFITEHRRAELAHSKAVGMTMMKGPMSLDLEPFAQVAHQIVDLENPFVFSGARWLRTSPLVDELMFRWNGLPEQARVELYMPGTNAEHIINLRNLRHAPRDVRLVDSHTLAIQPTGSTWIPLPPSRGGRRAGVITIWLPKGIKAGQRWPIDVTQMRGRDQLVVGGFQLSIQVKKAKEIAAAETRLLALTHKRLSYLDRLNMWHPILEFRLDFERKRAQALSEKAGLPWQDPTTWFEPNPIDSDGPGIERPITGRRLRIVLEKIEILDDRDPWIKGRGEVWFMAQVRSADNGGTEVTTRIPDKGIIKVSDKRGKNLVRINQEIFRGWVDGDLAMQITGTEKDTFDPDDPIGKYVKIFCGTAPEFIGSYGPSGTFIDPEDNGLWRVWYRVEYV